MPVTIIVIAAVIIVVSISSICVVPPGQAYVIERLGSFYAAWTEGIHYKMPFLDKVVKKVRLDSQTAELKHEILVCKDGKTLVFDAVAVLQVTDVERFAQSVDNPGAAAVQLIYTALRDLAGAMDSDDVLRTYDKISSRAFETVSAAIGQFGFTVHSISITNISEN